MRYIGTDIDISVEELLNKYLPKLYENSKVVKEFNKADAVELENIYNTVSNILDQFFVQTATWGLDLWEKEYEIPTNPDLNFEQRRTALYAKINSKNVFNKKSALDLATKNARDGYAEFEEFNEEYAFITRFNIDELINEELLISSFKSVKPAHLKHMIGYILRLTVGISKQSDFYMKLMVDINDYILLNGEYALDGGIDLTSVRDSQKFKIQMKLFIDNMEV